MKNIRIKYYQNACHESKPGNVFFPILTDQHKFSPDFSTLFQTEGTLMLSS